MNECTHACECVGAGRFYCVWIAASTYTVYWALTLIGRRVVLASCPALVWSSNLIWSALLCSCLVFCSVFLCSVLYYSVLFCFVTSCLELCHAVLTRIALFLCFTAPCSRPFYALCHCGVCVTLHYVYFVPKPYLTTVFLSFTLFRSLTLL